MAGWTSQMGFPYVRVLEQKRLLDSDRVQLTLRQTRFLADGSGGTTEEAAKPTMLWKIPLGRLVWPVANAAAAGSCDLQSDDSLMTEREQSFVFECAPPGHSIKVRSVGRRFLLAWNRNSVPV